MMPVRDTIDACRVQYTLTGALRLHIAGVRTRRNSSRHVSTLQYAALRTFSHVNLQVFFCTAVLAVREFFFVQCGPRLRILSIFEYRKIIYVS